MKFTVTVSAKHITFGYLIQNELFATQTIHACWGVAFVIFVPMVKLQAGWMVLGALRAFEGSLERLEPLAHTMLISLYSPDISLWVFGISFGLKRTGTFKAAFVASIRIVSVLYKLR